MLWHFKWVLGAVVLACALPAAAQPYDGPPSSMTRYWEVQAFKDFPYKGPDKAVGALFWSHGLAGTNPQYHVAPPAIIVEFARRGWDVVKVQRNPVFESGWNNGGERHVADLLERVTKARASGYKAVIVAGQSYGGAISIEAAGRTDKILGVLAFAPGHGSDACGAGGVGAARTADMLAGALMPAIEKVKAPRVVLSMADGDECQGTNRPTASIERALQTTGQKYIHLDNTMPIRGHGAAGTQQFSVWYRDCLTTFLAPDKEPAAKRTVCPAPPNSRFLTPAGTRLEAVAAANGDLAGAWFGKMTNTTGTAGTGVEVCVIVEKFAATEASGNVYFGSGPGQNTNMSTTAFRAQKDGAAFVHKGADNYRIMLTPKAGDANLTLTIVSRDAKGQWNVEMRRGCAG
jgi:dienelactone hydrolase